RTPGESDRHPPDRHFLRMVYAPARSFGGEHLVLTAGPSISAREVSYVIDAARAGWNHEWSKYLGRFERAFAEYIGVKHALATSRRHSAWASWSAPGNWSRPSGASSAGTRKGSAACRTCASIARWARRAAFTG